MTNREFPRNILHLRRGEYKSYINIYVPVKHAFKVRIAHLLQQHTCIFLEFFCSLDTLNGVNIWQNCTFCVQPTVKNIYRMP